MTWCEAGMFLEQAEQNIFDSSISCVHLAFIEYNSVMCKVLVSHEISNSNTQSAPKRYARTKL